MKNKIDLLDVTLRDGGFTCDFSWSIDFAREYYSLLSRSNVKYIELGYWKQTSKSLGNFYNLDIDTIKKVTLERGLRNAAVMVDYHYCNKDIKSYPTTSQNEIKMIRVTARKDLIDEVVPFVKRLKDHSGLEISFNIFNVSNYTKDEVMRVVDKIQNLPLEYVYLADTHGTLDLENDLSRYEEAFKTLKQSGKKTGFHLHNHTGRALSNYKECKSSEFIDCCDTSLMGLGKGAGNLHLEQVLESKKDIIHMANFIHKNKGSLGVTKETAYYILTGILSVTDNYARQAAELNIPIDIFEEFCLSLQGIRKDNFDKEKLLRLV